MTISPDVPTIEFLRHIPTAYLPHLLELAEERQFVPGAVLFREGSIHPYFHLISSGHVRLAMNIPVRGRIPMLTVGPGDPLAWSALVAEGMMTATGTALEQVTTLAFDGTRLRHLCGIRPEIGYHVMKQLAASLSRRLVATRLQLLDLFSTETADRDAVAAEDSNVDD